jgi:hypothetical protein
VTTELAVAQGMVKQVVQESVEKLKTHITAEMIEGICNKKHKQGKISQLQGKHFRSSWRPGRNPEVARDEPQVSVGGLLEQVILGQVLGIMQEKMHVTSWLRRSMHRGKEDN